MLWFFFPPWCPCPWLLLNRSLSRCATSFKLASLANNYTERSSCSKSNAQLTFEFLTRNLPVESYFCKPKHLIHSRDVTSTQELVPARNDKTVVSSRNVACFLELTWANDYEPFFFSSPRSARFARQFSFSPRSIWEPAISSFWADRAKVGKKGPTDRKLASQRSHGQFRIKPCINKARGVPIVHLEV